MSVLIPFVVMIAYGFVLALVAMYLDRWRGSKPRKPEAAHRDALMEELVKMMKLAVTERPLVTTTQK